MLRNTFISFICGWLVWFWIDKPSRGLEPFLQADDSLLVNFQRAFDLAKSGYIAQSYVYIWYAHYLLLSLIFGILAAYLYGFISDYFAHRRRKISFTSILQKRQNIKENSRGKNSDLSLGTKTDQSE